MYTFKLAEINENLMYKLHVSTGYYCNMFHLITNNDNNVIICIEQLYVFPITEALLYMYAM